MMSVYVPLVLEAMERLDRELLRIHRNVRGVTAWPLPNSVEIQSILAAVHRACAVTRNIREQVLHVRDTDDLCALRASSLRARSSVLAFALSELERVASTVTDPPAGRFSSVCDFKEHLLGEIGKITATWMREVERDRVTGVSDDASTLARAETAYAALGADAAVTEFLAWGMAQRSLAFSSTCRVVAVLVGAALQPSATAEAPTHVEITSLPPSLLAHMASAGRSKE